MVIEGGKGMGVDAQQFSRDAWRKRTECSDVGVVSLSSKNGAPSLRECMVNVQMNQATAAGTSLQSQRISSFFPGFSPCASYYSNDQSICTSEDRQSRLLTVIIMLSPPTPSSGRFLDGRDQERKRISSLQLVPSVFHEIEESCVDME